MKVNKKDLLENYFEEAKEKLKEMVRIPSYREDDSKGKPVPENIKKVLRYAIDLCKSWGMKTFIDEEYRYGYADWENGEKLFGILCHLDVVPGGDLTKWFSEPFEPIEKNGKLIGRGTYDDKGPTIMNLYAVKYLMDHGFKPDYTIRFIFGTSEETTWECMEKYVKNERKVDLGYVPDANFPVVYAEKWIADLDLKGKFTSNFTLIGGNAYNAVCDIAEYKGPKMDEIKSFLENEGVATVERKNETLIIRGQSAHGSMPQLGNNAITFALNAIYNVGIEHPLAELTAKQFHKNHNIEQIVGNLEDETGKLTMCIGKLRITENDYFMTFNFRIPCTRDPKKDFVNSFVDYIKKQGMDIDLVGMEDSVFFDTKGEVVSNIMKVYQEVTGDFESKPIAIGGGTFAKSMPNLIAFGAEFDIEHTSMHTNNESVKIEELQKMLEIYTKALVILTKEKNA